MSEKVVSLGSRRPARSGTAQCLACHHEWSAVAPLGVVDLECPTCHLLRGVFDCPHGMNTGYEVWACKTCSGHFMKIYRHMQSGGFYVMCSTCGQLHETEAVFG